MSINFPKEFLWGVATAAYQIEGAVKEDGRGPSIWDVFSHTPGKVIHGDTGDIACDQYHRLEADLDLLFELGIKAYRFSIAWSRVLPQGQGQLNQAGVAYYERLVDGLLKRNITPMVTLYHWDLPQALQEKGGWLNRDTAYIFADYAGQMHRIFGDRIPFWITLNEPWCSAFLGHQQGVHAPGIQDEAAALTATHHLLLAHGLGVAAMRAENKSTNLGITLNLTSNIPASATPADLAATRRVDGQENRLFLDPLFRGVYPADMVEHYRPVSAFQFVKAHDLDIIKAPFDFLGINYYERHLVKADPADKELGAIQMIEDGPRTAGGIGINPEGLEDLLLRVKTDYTDLPLYITENGMAYHDYVDPEGQVKDEERTSYLDDHFRAAHAALLEGVDLRGYFVWSFLDVFEWALGYSKRFGIVYVDYRTQTRIPKLSAQWYSKIIAQNGLCSISEDC